jgi:hypothetical protein
MREREGVASSQLDRVRRSLERWRREHGGPGRLIPEEIWDEAVVVARTEGVEAAAGALRLGRARLASRMEQAAGSKDATATAGDFVEIPADDRCAPGQTVVRLVGRDGDRLEIVLSARSAVDVTALARAFLDRLR